MNFHRKTLAAAAFLAVAGISGIASAEMTKIVGGAPMYPSKNIIQNAVNSKDNTTLVAAVKAAGLVDTLQGPGPFTVFAPTNAAFAQLPAGTVDSLLKPENKDQLATVLTYHVVPGRLTASDLKDAIKDGGGEATFKTVQGEPLTFSQKGRAIEITDSKSRTARVTIADVLQSNGVIHVINKVLMP
ncbi:MAG: fasciclin domain-containing protein [Beijerinckiaceae bacterium]|nr:fasciclin domain-containing protein [Beijerinckiaceae bacterium]